MESIQRILDNMAEDEDELVEFFNTDEDRTGAKVANDRSTYKRLSAYATEQLGDLGLPRRVSRKIRKPLYFEEQSNGKTLGDFVKAEVDRMEREFGQN